MFYSLTTHNPAPHHPHLNLALALFLLTLSAQLYNAIYVVKFIFKISL